MFIRELSMQKIFFRRSRVNAKPIPIVRVSGSAGGTAIVIRSRDNMMESIALAPCCCL